MYDTGSDEGAGGEFNVDEKECADFPNKPASKPGKHGALLRESKGSGTPHPPKHPGATTSTAPMTPTTTPTPSPGSRNEPEPTRPFSPTPPDQWPKSNGDKSELERALKVHRIFFYFAYGMECPHKP